MTWFIFKKRLGDFGLALTGWGWREQGNPQSYYFLPRE